VTPPGKGATIAGMTDDIVFSLAHQPVHLGLGATVARQDAFTGEPSWYEAYGRRNESDGVEGRLVTMHSFEEPWSSWEQHPYGEELVVCTKGTITLFQEVDGEVRSVVLHEGDAIVNPPGVWHTADVDQPCTALFITAGMGTENRAR
jgi:quercetin dioxygenase-like cupin family protein